MMECSSHAQLASFLATGTVAAVLPATLAASISDVTRYPMREADGFRRGASLFWLPGRLSVLPELEEARKVLIQLMG